MHRTNESTQKCRHYNTNRDQLHRQSQSEQVDYYPTIMRPGASRVEK